LGENIVQKILKKHLVEGELKVGKPISLSIDQVLTQDATGTMAYLQFEAIGVPRVRIPLAVSYVDHNTLQSNYFNNDDHRFLQTSAAKYGAVFSRPGNGICHQVNLERFGKPGNIMLGSDSHTPTGGGVGMLAIGVGGLDIATVMAGSPFEVSMPAVLQVKLTGKLRRPWVTGMDVILEVLRRLSVKGGVGRIIEYSGEGVKNLSVVERATITNMGAELGATTSVFPSDEKTKAFLKAQGREDDWSHLEADEDAVYDTSIEIELDKLEPLIAQPHSPDNVVAVRELVGLKVDQVCVGSCTNSSYSILKSVASLLKGNKISETCSMLLSPGSKQAYEMLARDGGLADIIASGARVLESACGPCIGMGGAPKSEGVTIRSFNRNFKGRSGTADARIYLCNPLVAAAFALFGEIIDVMKSDLYADIPGEAETFLINDNMLIFPPEDSTKVVVEKGPNIKDVPVKEPLCDSVGASVLIKLGDNITTDDIMPAGSRVLPYRSNIPAMSDFVFEQIDPEFPSRAKNAGKGIIVGGENYGQGSSREHAALVPMFLGIQAVIVKSFARIHKANLINFGILPLTFDNPDDYEKVAYGDHLLMGDLLLSVKGGKNVVKVENKTRNLSFNVNCELSPRQKDIIFAGGLLPYTRERNKVD